MVPDVGAVGHPDVFHPLAAALPARPACSSGPGWSPRSGAGRRRSSRCRLRSRPRSNASGSANSPPSRLAEAQWISTLSPVLMDWPASSVSRTAVRPTETNEGSRRSSSWMASGISPGRRAAGRDLRLPAEPDRAQAERARGRLQAAQDEQLHRADDLVVGDRPAVDLGAMIASTTSPRGGRPRRSSMKSLIHAYRPSQHSRAFGVLGLDDADAEVRDPCPGPRRAR